MKMKTQQPPVKYSMFDLTQKEIGQALPYALIPIDVIHTLPNSTYWLNYDVQIQFRNPTIRKLMNGFRVYLHSYYNRNSDLWEGWNNFITKGREGLGSTNVPLEIPHLKTRYSSGVRTTPFTPMSLYDYLGYPPEYIPNANGTMELDKYTGLKHADLSNTVGDFSATETKLARYDSAKINALPAMMYQKLWRDKYSPQNLIQNNKEWFPNNEDHFILSYDASEVSIISYGNENYNNFTTNEKTGTVSIENQTTGYTGKARIDQLRFRQFQGDRFTTASPFADMLRGTAPNIELSIDSSNLTINLTKDNTSLYFQKSDSTTEYTSVLGYFNNNQADNLETYLSPSETTNWDAGQGYFYTKGTNIPVNGTSIASTIKLKDLRALEVFTIFAERMARSKGMYNDLIYSQYGYNPEAQTREAIYIGGSYQDIVQNSIFQTTNEENSPLGTQAGQGISASYNKIGKFHSKDYGIIMTILSIVPETIYTTGINKLDTGITFEDMYYPIMNNLSAEPILKKEIYASGDTTTDENLWGYAERFEEYKSRRNRVKGFSQLPSDKDRYDSALVMARRFSVTQNLNANWVTGIPSNVSLESFASTNEPPFDYNIIKDVRAKLPMPYITIPQGLGTRA